MSDNLPPGCSSPDGGIDHAFESALESFAQAVDSAEEIRHMSLLLITFRAICDEVFRAGFEEGELAKAQEIDQCVTDNELVGIAVKNLLLQVQGMEKDGHLKAAKFVPLTAAAKTLADRLK